MYNYDKEDLRKRVKRVYEDVGVEVDTLKSMTPDEFEKYEALVNKWTAHYQDFIEKMNKVFLNDWTINEVFVFFVDMMNARFVEYVYQNSGEEVTEETIFPGLYKQIYDKCVKQLLDGYLGEYDAEKDLEDEDYKVGGTD